MLRNFSFLVFFMGTWVLCSQDNIFLQRAFWQANPTIAQVEAAIAEGNDITELNGNLFDGACYALLENVDNTTIQHILSKKGNGVDKMTHDGRTYMFWAAYRGNLDMMEWLVQRGAKCDIEDAHGNNIINFAANAGQRDTALYDFLLGHGADINSTTRSGANALLLVSSSATDFNILTYFNKKGLSMQSVDAAGNGIFQYAAKGGNISFLKDLVAKGVATNADNAKGENALFMAARGTRSKQNDKAVFDYLMGLGLEPDMVSTDGSTLLHYLSGKNKDEALYKDLINSGLKADLANKEGTTPLMMAARSNDLAIVSLLASHTKNINLQDKKGQSALTMAVARNEPAVVDFLLSKDADHTVVDTKGNTLAYYLAQSYDPKKPEPFEEKLASLTKAGVQLQMPQHNGNSLLHVAAKDNNLSLLKRLATFNMDINQKNDEGNTVLHLAAMSTGNTEVLEYLISQGADVAVKTEFQETVYDLAKENELLQGKATELDFLKSE